MGVAVHRGRPRVPVPTIRPAGLKMRKTTVYENRVGVVIRPIIFRVIGLIAVIPAQKKFRVIGLIATHVSGLITTPLYKRNVTHDRVLTLYRF